MELPSARVLVVGDSGVGKTTLLRAACRDPGAERRDAGAPQWTTGCDVHVLHHQFREAYGAEKEAFVEFVDVGGHPKYEISRSMFYYDVHGVIFVYDLTNAKSYDHLRMWSSEIARTQRLKGCVVPSSMGAARPGEYPSLNALPKLVIGNKKDAIKPQEKRPTVLPELRNIESTESSGEPYSLDPTVFRGFLDRVVAFANSGGGGSNGDGAYADYNSAGSGGFMSPFSDGLRQVKSKPNGTAATSASTPRSGGGGGGGAARGWWK